MAKLRSIKINEFVKVMDVVNNENNTKTIMTTDFYNTAKYLGHNVAKVE